MIQNLCPKINANDSVLCTIFFLFLSLSFNSVSSWRRVARSLGDCIEQNMNALCSMLKLILKYEYIA